MGPDPATPKRRVPRAGRREALRTLAASGIGAAAAVVISQPAFAAGGSTASCGASPDWPGGTSVNTISYADNGLVNLGLDSNGGFCLPNWSSPAYFQWHVTARRVSPTGDDPTLVGITPGWSTPIVNPHSNVVAFQLSGSTDARYEVVVHFRAICCRDSNTCRAWGCRRCVMDFTIRQYSAEVHTRACSIGDDSATCNSQVPMCV